METPAPDSASLLQTQINYVLNDTARWASIQISEQEGKLVVVGEPYLSPDTLNFEEVKKHLKDEPRIVCISLFFGTQKKGALLLWCGEKSTPKQKHELYVLFEKLSNTGCQFTHNIQNLEEINEAFLKEKFLQANMIGPAQDRENTISRNLSFRESKKTLEYTLSARNLKAKTTEPEPPKSASSEIVNRFLDEKVAIRDKIEKESLQELIEEIQKEEITMKDDGKEHLIELKWDMDYPSDLKTCNRFKEELLTELSVVYALKSTDSKTIITPTKFHSMRRGSIIVLVGITSLAIGTLLLPAGRLVHYLHKCYERRKSKKDTIIAEAQFNLQPSPTDALKRSFPRILCLDGGGVKSLISLAILKKLEERLHARFPERYAISDLFDYIVGTSSGALLALLLRERRNLTIDEIIREYQPLMKEMYPDTIPQLFTGIMSKLFTGSYYNTDCFKKFVDNLLPAPPTTGASIKRNEKMLGEISRPIAMVTTNVSKQKIEVIDSSSNEHLELLKALKMTTATPGLFSSVMHHGDEYVDGSVGATNPTKVFCDKFFGQYKQLAGSLPVVVSVGCGVQRSTYEGIKAHEEKQIANRKLDTPGNIQRDHADFAKNIKNVNYCRLQPTVDILPEIYVTTEKVLDELRAIPWEDSWMTPDQILDWCLARNIEIPISHTGGAGQSGDVSKKEDK